MSNLLKRGGTVSIKKGSGSADHEEKPAFKESDILLDRFLELKSITKGFISYYEDLAKLETSNAEQITKIGGHIAVPLKDASQFLPQGGAGGWQDILYYVRDETRAIAEQHTNLSHSITNGIVHSLQHTKTEIKNFLTELEAEPARLAKVVDEQRAESTRLISTLSHGLAAAKGNAMALTPKEDPVLLHRHVDAQLKKQINDENALTRSLQTYQARARDLESKVVRDIQKATADFSKSYATARTAITKDWEAIHAKIGSLDAEIEFAEYAKRSGFLIPEDAPMRDHAQISFPGQNDDHAKPLKSGMLQRKKRFTKNYKEAFYVLTPAGFLHEFKSSDPAKQGEPEMSLFLPNCILGPPAAPGGKNKWHVESKKATGGGSFSKMRKVVGKKEIAYSFKANSHSAMTEWWQAMEGPAKASMMAATSSSNLQDGTAVTAVRDLGYSSEGKEAGAAAPAAAAAAAPEEEEEEEEEEDEEEGSSDEEEPVDAPTEPIAGQSSAPAPETLPEYKTGEHAVASDVKEKPTLGNDTPQASTSAA